MEKQVNKIKAWQRECNNFEKWFKRLGGDISNTSQMNNAFTRIEPKGVEVSPIYKFFA